MLTDMLRVFPAALVVCVAPGWFWTALLRGKADIPERIAFSIGFSMTLVPALVLLIIHLSGTGVTFAVAIFCALGVFVAGLLLWLAFGAADQADGYRRSLPSLLNLPTLALLSAALGLMLWAAFAVPEERWYLLVTSLLVVLAGVVGWFGDRPDGAPEPPADEPPTGETTALRRVVRGSLLSVVLAGVLARGYAGPALYDWPYLRGGDRFNHAVMANEMLSKGNYDAYLVYPPGFHVLTAGVSRLGGLEPLEVFPVLAPALILLPALACYTLAKELWGWECGVAAAAFSGLLLVGTWENIEQARYPNLVAAQFLLVLGIVALVRLYRSPSGRSILSLALLGSSVVLYHSVASFYAALLLAMVAVLFLPYLLLRRRGEGVALLLSLVLLGVLSTAFAWDTYDLGHLAGGLVTGSGTGSGGEAVSIAIGTQPPLGLPGLPGRVSPPLFWLGLLGGLLLLAPVRNRKDLPDLLSRATLLLWCVILFVGSRTALSGFPQRFERDLGIPLSILAAFALVAVLRSLASSLRASGFGVSGAAFRRGVVSTVAAALALFVVVLGVWKGIEDATAPDPGAEIPPAVATAGEWLKEHNTGGNIVPMPSYGNIPSRGMLALGGYAGLQAYPERRVETPRSLPPGGIREIKAARWLPLHPQSERAKRIVGRYDVRYVVLVKGHPGVDPGSFEARPDLYRKEFENKDIVIFAPQSTS